MKRLTLAVALFLAAAAMMMADTSEYYPVRVDVVKVWSHAEGYRVLYRKGLDQTAEVLLPASWFKPGGKAELVKAIGPAYPYMVVFYKGEGKFDHLRLYVLPNQTDPSWGSLDPAEGRGVFNGIEDVKLQF